jgi:ppGpp synthetase/RelA/SpoT-type nucleotidyltranferase
MTNGDRSLEQWGEIYGRTRPIISAFVDKLEIFFDELLDDYEWSYTWANSEDDFIARLYRARRLGVTFENPLQELLGFAGLGIVVADLNDADSAAEMIEKELEVNFDISALRTEDGNDPPFRQYFVSVPSAWTALTEWRPYEGLWVNVDVQTLLQYASERADNGLPYHWPRSYPPEIQQQIADYSSLVTAADERFNEIRSSILNLQVEYEDGILLLDPGLNGISLYAYLESSDTVKELVRIGIAAGLKEPEPPISGMTRVEQGTLWLLKRGGIETVPQLNEFLQTATPRAHEILAEIARLSIPEGAHPGAGADAIVDWLFVVLRRADAETVSLLRYWDQIENALNTLIGNPVQAREEEP